jgi:hypothetical protein
LIQRSMASRTVVLAEVKVAAPLAHADLRSRRHHVLRAFAWLFNTPGSTRAQTQRPRLSTRATAGDRRCAGPTPPIHAEDGGFSEQAITRKEPHVTKPACARAGLRSLARAVARPVGSRVVSRFGTQGLRNDHGDRPTGICIVKVSSPSQASKNSAHFSSASRRSA